mmetsp:Transcript_31040/g.71028  ORF Transcript_31040/g.71028 Transcript_31040/m.71028 type:complete len:90 (-) Transcript_31040:7066-7335(-)
MIDCTFNEEQANTMVEYGGFGSMLDLVNVSEQDLYLLTKTIQSSGMMFLQKIEKSLLAIWYFCKDKERFGTFFCQQNDKIKKQHLCGDV